jgi:hypothetical protein
MCNWRRQHLLRAAAASPGTDLEDVACLPGISDFRPGVYHMPSTRARDNSADDDWHSEQQQQQRQPASPSGLCPGGSSSSGDRCVPSWAAEVCLRSQQLPGRVSVSNWLDDDETGAACEALCAFAVPALSPSCSAQPADDAAASSNSVACDGSQPSSSVCSEDSRPSSRQSSSTTAGFGSSVGLGGPLAESSSMGSGCLAAAEAPFEWDMSLHLPLWVSRHEREAIEARLDGWVERLLEVGADVRGLAGEQTRCCAASGWAARSASALDIVSSALLCMLFACCSQIGFLLGRGVVLLTCCVCCTSCCVALQLC